MPGRLGSVPRFHAERDGRVVGSVGAVASELGGEAPAEAPSELVVESYGNGLDADVALAYSQDPPTLRRLLDTLD